MEMRGFNIEDLAGLKTEELNNIIKILQALVTMLGKKTHGRRNQCCNKSHTHPGHTYPGPRPSHTQPNCSRGQEVGENSWR